MQLKSQLSVKTGVATSAGPNESNEDCLGIRIPQEPDLSTKGITAAIADGVSAADEGKQAAEICVKGFLNDFYDAPEAWTTKTAGTKVINALNRWLYSLGQSYTNDGHGYLTTLSAIALKATTAVFFHIGDSRIYRIRDGHMEQMTRDHTVRFGKKKYGLARSMGMDTNVEIDCRQAQLQAGDRFLLTTDGIHGFLGSRTIEDTVSKAGHDLNDICSELVANALDAGSNDNCSAVIVDVVNAGTTSNDELYRHFRRLPFPPDLYPGMSLDGYEVVSELQATSRSQTYIVRDRDTGEKMVMKTPSVNFEDENSYIERFIMEAWIGSKVTSDHLASSTKPARGQTFLYTLLEYIEGVTLSEWMEQNANPDIKETISITKNVILGLRAMHRQEMLHQDMKPSNVIINPKRGAVIIDFGSTFVPGIQEISTPFKREQALGTLDYSAPEYILGRKPTSKSDLFSVGVMLYEVLTGSLPYGKSYENCHTLRDFAALEYIPSTRHNSMVPTWIDGAIRKAVQINPQSRYDTFSEFEYDLEHPNKEFLPTDSIPFIERKPALFWKITAAILALSQGITLWYLLKK